MRLRYRGIQGQFSVPLIAFQPGFDLHAPLHLRWHVHWKDRVRVALKDSYLWDWYYELRYGRISSKALGLKCARCGQRWSRQRLKADPAGYYLGYSSISGLPRRYLKCPTCTQNYRQAKTVWKGVKICSIERVCADGRL